jgi:hypothetical protein
MGKRKRWRRLGSGGRKKIEEGEPHLESLFPSLVPDVYREKSNPTKQYNCFAWAAHDATKKWSDMIPDFWPDEVTRDGSIQGYIRLFEFLGFERCKDGRPEEDFEKVALYGNDSECFHAARLKPNNSWTSKIGNRVDIDHDTLECLECDDYGKVKAFLRRRKGFVPC